MEAWKAALGVGILLVVLRVFFGGGNGSDYWCKTRTDLAGMEYGFFAKSAKECQQWYRENK